MTHQIVQCQQILATQTINFIYQCVENLKLVGKEFYAVNVSKIKIFSVKGNLKVEVNGIVLEETAEMKD